MKLNKNFDNLKQSYLFVEIAKRVESYKAANPGADVIRLGIGDVTRPLTPTVIDALHKASAEMGTPEGFRGYSPDSAGYTWLREAIASCYEQSGVNVTPDEVQVNDGAKSDLGNFFDVLGSVNVLVPDPVYPAYVDTNIIFGNAISYVSGNEENGFLPMPSDISGTRPDVIYICSPNNPTGAVYDKTRLTEWVNYALDNDALILFDAAYAEFIAEPSLPKSIFEIDGARKCAVEFGTLSKMAGFTGTRCGWTVIPDELEYDGAKLGKMWYRRQSVKFNGVPYIIQRAAEAVMSAQGLREARELIGYYRENAKTITSALDRAGIKYTGGANSPYVWLKCGRPSWDYFDYLLTEKNIVGTPGAGFGSGGEGWFRVTAFGTHENTVKAAERIVS
ncbi:MAG: LL-diaminopimelate aminotransferase [Oscillospiraceae bacterium]|jgi:LL-diaminopimelate aminotransferase|nr:LL-diaminopimelate aminotransferase [Oscillospiraceae bacterium]